MLAAVPVGMSAASEMAVASIAKGSPVNLTPKQIEELGTMLTNETRALYVLLEDGLQKRQKEQTDELLFGQEWLSHIITSSLSRLEQTLQNSAMLAQGPSNEAATPARGVLDEVFANLDAELTWFVMDKIPLELESFPQKTPGTRWKFLPWTKISADILKYQWLENATDAMVPYIDFFIHMRVYRPLIRHLGVSSFRLEIANVLEQLLQQARNTFLEEFVEQLMEERLRPSQVTVQVPFRLHVGNWLSKLPVSLRKSVTNKQQELVGKCFKAPYQFQQLHMVGRDPTVLEIARQSKEPLTQMDVYSSLERASGRADKTVLEDFQIKLFYVRDVLDLTWPLNLLVLSKHIQPTLWKFFEATRGEMTRGVQSLIQGTKRRRMFDHHPEEEDDHLVEDLSNIFGTSMFYLQRQVESAFGEVPPPRIQQQKHDLFLSSTTIFIDLPADVERMERMVEPFTRKHDVDVWIGGSPSSSTLIHYHPRPKNEGEILTSAAGSTVQIWYDRDGTVTCFPPHMKKKKDFPFTLDVFIDPFKKAFLVLYTDEVQRMPKERISFEAWPEPDLFTSARGIILQRPAKLGIQTLTVFSQSGEDDRSIDIETRKTKSEMWEVLLTKPKLELFTSLPRTTFFIRSSTVMDTVGPFTPDRNVDVRVGTREGVQTKSILILYDGHLVDGPVEVLTSATGSEVQITYSLDSAKCEPLSTWDGMELFNASHGKTYLVLDSAQEQVFAASSRVKPDLFTSARGIIVQRPAKLGTQTLTSTLESGAKGRGIAIVTQSTESGMQVEILHEGDTLVRPRCRQSDDCGHGLDDLVEGEEIEGWNLELFTPEEQGHGPRFFIKPTTVTDTMFPFTLKEGAKAWLDVYQKPTLGWASTKSVLIHYPGRLNSAVEILTSARGNTVQIIYSDEEAVCSPLHVSSSGMELFSSGMELFIASDKKTYLVWEPPSRDQLVYKSGQRFQVSPLSVFESPQGGIFVQDMVANHGTQRLLTSQEGHSMTIVTQSTKSGVQVEILSSVVVEQTTPKLFTSSIPSLVFFIGSSTVMDTVGPFTLTHDVDVWTSQTQKKSFLLLYPGHRDGTVEVLTSATKRQVHMTYESGDRALCVLSDPSSSNGMELFVASDERTYLVWEPLSLDPSGTQYFRAPSRSELTIHLFTSPQGEIIVQRPPVLGTRVLTSTSPEGHSMTIETESTASGRQVNILSSVVGEGDKEDEGDVEQTTSKLELFTSLERTTILIKETAVTGTVGPRTLASPDVWTAKHTNSIIILYPGRPDGADEVLTSATGSQVQIIYSDGSAYCLPLDPSSSSKVELFTASHKRTYLVWDPIGLNPAAPFQLEPNVDLFTLPQGEIVVQRPAKLGIQVLTSTLTEGHSMTIETLSTGSGMQVEILSNGDGGNGPGAAGVGSESSDGGDVEQTSNDPDPNVPVGQSNGNGGNGPGAAGVGSESNGDGGNGPGARGGGSELKAGATCENSVEDVLRKAERVKDMLNDVAQMLPHLQQQLDTLLPGSAHDKSSGDGSKGPAAGGGSEPTPAPTRAPPPPAPTRAPPPPAPTQAPATPAPTPEGDGQPARSNDPGPSDSVGQTSEAGEDKGEGGKGNGEQTSSGDGSKGPGVDGGSERTR